MKSPIDGVGLTVTAVGGVLLYSGLKGYSVLSVLTNLITGKPIATGVGNTQSLIGDGTSGIADTVTSSTAQFFSGGNKGIGQSLASNAGWTGGEWDALSKLWDRESGWRNRAENPSSGAYGIPQSLPYSKMPKAAWPEKAGGTSDAATQIQWGIDYIKGRYGSPSMAWAHETANGWY